MNLNEKQRAILGYCNDNGQITNQDAVYMFKTFYYSNAEKYVGEILSRMVNSGKLIRIKPGVFHLGKGKAELEIKNQINLF